MKTTFKIITVLLLALAVNAQVSVTSIVGVGKIGSGRYGTKVLAGQSYLIQQDFEGAGFDNSETWTKVGAGQNEDYTATVLVGSQSMNMVQGSTTNETVSPVYTLTSGQIHYAYFQLRVTTFPTASNYRIFSISNTVDVAINSTSNLVVRPYVGTGVATVDHLIAGTTYHVWITGSGQGVEVALNGKGTVGFSTTGIRPTSGNSFASDTDASANPPVTSSQVLLGSRQIGGNYDVIIDKVRVSDFVIGDNPQ
jgi:hypothetical protein